MKLKIYIYIRDENNELCQLKNLYTTYFSESFKFLFEIDNILEVQSSISKVYKDLQNFIRVYRDCLHIYYNFDCFRKTNYNLFIMFRKENILDYVISLLLDEKIHNTILNLQRICDISKEKRILMTYETFKNSQPENLGVNEKFSLNMTTLHFLKKNSLLTDDKVLMEKTIKMIQIKEPYEEAIDCFKNIQYVKSPIHKIKILMKVTESILNSIMEFYSMLDISIDLSEIDSDELMNIYVYIFVKAYVKSVISHFNMIDMFITEKLLDSVMGYYFVILKSSLNLLYENDFLKYNKKKVQIYDHNEIKEELSENSYCSNGEKSKKYIEPLEIERFEEK